MARAKRICPKAKCNRPADGRYCTEHNREYEAQRGSAKQRGYDAAHRKLRLQWRQRIDQGGVHCASPTCGKPISPHAPFDLGHTDDRSGYIGAQHPSCNRSEGGTKGRAAQG